MPSFIIYARDNLPCLGFFSAAAYVRCRKTRGVCTRGQICAKGSFQIKSPWTVNKDISGDAKKNILGSATGPIVALPDPHDQWVCTVSNAPTAKLMRSPGKRRTLPASYDYP